MEPVDFYNSEFKQAMEVIGKHWMSMVEKVDKSNIDKREKPNFQPWFGDIEQWLIQLKKASCNKTAEFDLSAQKIYPKALASADEIHNIAVELDLLLPADSKIICDMLPVLVTGYLSNRRVPDEGGMKNDYEGTPALVNCILDNKKKTEQLRKFINSKEGLFRIKDWYERFPKIRYAQLDRGKAQMLLSGYGLIRIFYLLLYKMQDICNVSLSFLCLR